MKLLNIHNHSVKYPLDVIMKLFDDDLIYDIEIGTSTENLWDVIRDEIT